MSVGTAQGAPSRSGLQPGQVVGGRFRVEGAASEDALGSVLAARDDKTGKAIALRVLPRGLLADAESQKFLRGEIKTAAMLTHKSVVATYGVGSDPSGSSFIACEWVEGHSLSNVVAHRRATGTQLSLKGAYNVIAHVCKALAFAHGKGMVHGALRPSVVWISKSGRVKVGDFGVGRAVVTRAGAAALGADEQACLAPEVKQGHPPTERSDIFGVGALLYAMLTGRSPAEAFIAPSQAHPDATPQIDQVLMQCLGMDPSSRFASPEDVRQALLPLVAHAPDATASDFGIDVDVDVDLASARPAAPARQVPTPQIPRHSPIPGAADRPRVGERVSIHDQFRAPKPGGSSQSNAVTPAAPAPEQASSAMVDLATLLARITENDAPRWMVVKDNLDHGPFSGREP